MITYRKLWMKCEQRGISKKQLKNKYHFGKRTVDHLKNDEPVNTTTLNKLCYILDCDLSEIMEFYEDESEKIDILNDQTPNE